VDKDIIPSLVDCEFISLVLLTANLDLRARLSTKPNTRQYFYRCVSTLPRTFRACEFTMFSDEAGYNEGFNHNTCSHKEAKNSNGDAGLLHWNSATE